MQLQMLGDLSLPVGDPLGLGEGEQRHAGGQGRGDRLAVRHPALRCIRREQKDSV
jgi:hypothetical protein